MKFDSHCINDEYTLKHCHKEKHIISMEKAGLHIMNMMVKMNLKLEFKEQ